MLECIRPLFAATAAAVASPLPLLPVPDDAGAAGVPRALVSDTGSAQDDVEDDAAEDDAAADDTTRGRRRILYLEHGRPLRAVAREREGRWEVRGTGGAWRALPPGAVTRAVPERDVLRLLDEHRTSLEASDVPAARTALAEWMLANGLVREAFEHLDALLEERPHDEHALALLRREDFVALPRADSGEAEGAPQRARLCAWGSVRGLAAREVAIGELGRTGEREDLRTELTRELDGGPAQRRSFAAQALGRLFPGEHLEALCTHAIFDRSDEARRHASRALGAGGDGAVLAPLVRALESERARVRLRAAAAIGQVGLPAGVEPLMGALAAAGTGAGRVPHSHLFVGTQTAYVSDFDVEVAMAAAVADPTVNTLIEGSVLDVGVIGVSEVAFATHSRVIRASLERLTGERPGSTARAWEAWWRRHRSRWQARLRPPVTEAR
ncbi:MAG: hypothetical protein CMJ84_01975 [Planctomycetes bacterium]|jgi:hypothetical protein|nr:hypothetical protein [Planctomycetota bacterium]MDP6408847.1 HEAT repeat domain-containing protein [Planctomycetota bacterium]